MDMKRIISLLLCLVLAVSLAAPAAAAPALEVAGKSAVLMDIATGQVLYEKNAHENLPPASVTKIMTLLLIMEAIDSGVISWDDSVTASEAAAAKGGSQVYLKVGETMPVTDMVKSIAVSSANDCACAMAEYIAGSEAAFVEKMNQRAQELGMEDTHFVNCTGLDDAPEAAEHKTSAYDIALMSRELMKNHPTIRQYTTIWMDTVRDGQFGLSNTNKLIRYYPGATGLKTGFTAKAGHCLSATAERDGLTGFTAKAGHCLSATAERDGLELVAVVLGAESSAQRFEACKTLLDYGFANYALVRAQMPGEAFVPVRLGRSDKIQAVLGGDTALLLEKAQAGQVKTELTLEEEVTAPVSRGQRLGTLTVRAGEQVLMQVPLVASGEVERLTVWDLFLRLLRQVAMAKPTAGRS
jgi:D-alanyl-D-alanine carboxypeptidase (penicillin-binding protein 5/6)